LKKNEAKSMDKPKKGGRRPGAGRPKGVPNRLTRSLKEAAAQYTREALETIIDLMKNAESEDVRLRAAKEILDRGHGRPAQYVETASGTLDPELLEQIKTQFIVKMQLAHERQRAVLIERGLIVE
jgi:hypothetical protein